MNQHAKKVILTKKNTLQIQNDDGGDLEEINKKKMTFFYSSSLPTPSQYWDRL